MMMIFKKYSLLFSITTLSLLCYFSLFHKLDREAMHWWDESSYALNAQEMLEQGKVIEVFLFGKPDLYNSKPPFAIWCMALSVKYFGFNELGVRLPSALFALFTAVFLWFLGFRLTKSHWKALFLPLVLISSFGYVGEHISRTGDTDSILTFWILLQAVFLYKYCDSESSKQKNIYLYLTTLSLVLGCLTKGVAGLIAIPGMFVWLLNSKQLITTIIKKEFYVCVFFFFLIVLGYYFLRNYLTPGYLDAVIKNEIGGRVNKQDFLNKDTLPMYYYFQNMIEKNRYMVWIYVLPFSMVFILMQKKSKYGKLGLFAIIIFVSLSLFLAVSKTKLDWYDAPLYPIMAIVIGVSFYILMDVFSEKFAVFFVLAFIWPFYSIVSHNINSPLGSTLGKFMQAVRTKGYKNSIYIISADYNFSILFYIKQDALSGGHSESIHPFNNTLKPGDLILTEKQERDGEMNHVFNLKLIYAKNECKLYRIIDKK